jgi:hypothetical protein
MCLDLYDFYFHYDMARPQVATGGDVFQFSRVTANLLKKTSWTAGGVVFQLEGFA